MKKLGFVLLLFFVPILIFGQSLPIVPNDTLNKKSFDISGIPNDQTKKEGYKIPYLSLTFLFLGGVSDGIAETLKFHYDHFKHRFPDANDNLWNPDLSYKRKWKNGDPEQGERYLMSSSLLAWTTDPYHLLQSGTKASVCMAVVLKIGQHEIFKYYVYDFILCSAAYSLGFGVTFDDFFKEYK